MGTYRKVFAATAASAAAAAVYYSKEKHLKGGKTDQNDVLDGKSAVMKVPEAVINEDYKNCIMRSRKTLLRLKDELGLPGVVIGVSVNGQTVWAQGFGMANYETQTPCNSKTKMRIASISKPITVALLAKLKDGGLVDLDKPIQDYVSYFPLKKVDGKEVTLTPKLLACHKGGIRHYKDIEGSEGDGGPEFYLKDHFKSVEKSVELFKDDDLLFAPGEKFQYTTHGYTLLSAVIEGAGKKPFAEQLRQFLDHLDLKNTHLDEISTVIYNRASYYSRQKNGKLKNAELTDNSYKWAGGGLVSDVEDLLKFSNIMLFSYQQPDTNPGYLNAGTIKQLWSPQHGTKMSWDRDAGYGLGWTIVPQQKNWTGSGLRQRFHVGHGGGAVGASSVLVIFPLSPATTNHNPPSGVTVAIITNLQNVGLYKVAKEIANNFIECSEVDRYL